MVFGVPPIRADEGIKPLMERRQPVGVEPSDSPENVWRIVLIRRCALQNVMPDALQLGNERSNPAFGKESSVGAKDKCTGNRPIELLDVLPADPRLHEPYQPCLGQIPHMMEHLRR